MAQRFLAGLGVLVGLALAPVAWSAPPAPFLGGIADQACVASSAVGACTAGVGLAGGGSVPRTMVVSPDGLNVYYLAGTSNLVAALRRDPATGRLSSVPDDPLTVGDDGCVGDGDPSGTSAGSGGCVAARALLTPISMAISPDGNHVYVGSDGHDAISILQRNPTTGALRPVADPIGTAQHEDCLASQTTAAGNGCVPLGVGLGLDEPVAIVVSPDGKNVYVAASAAGSEAIAILVRTPGTGSIQALTPDPGLGAVRGCIAAGGGGGACGQGNVASNPSALAMAPNGSALYQAGANGVASAINALVRNPQTGELTLPANFSRCLQDDNRTLFFTGCTTTRNIQNPIALAVSADGTSLYAVVRGVADPSEDAGVSAMRLVSATEFAGIDEPAGCISRHGSVQGGVPTCQPGLGLHTPTSVAVSPDGLHVYVGAQESNAITVYDRNATTSGIAPVADNATTVGLDACLTASPNVGGLETVGCQRADLVSGPSALALSPNGAQLYAGGSNRVVTLQRELPPTCTPAAAAVVAGVAGTVALPCSDPNGDALTRSIASGPAQGVLGAVDQAAATVPYTANAAFVGADAFGFTVTDGVLAATPATASIAVTAPPPPPPPPPTAFTLDRVTVQGVRWRESRLVAGSLSVRGSVNVDASGRLSLTRTGTRSLRADPVCRNGRACAFVAGAFVRSLPLLGIPNLLPGAYRLTLGGATRAVTIPAPTEGVVRSLEFRASRNGGAVTRLRGPRREVWVVYRLAAVPKRGPVTVTWQPPGTVRPLIGDKPRAGTIVSNVRARDGATLPAGVWKVTLRAAGKVVKRATIRIG